MLGGGWFLAVRSRYFGGGVRVDGENKGLYFVIEGVELIRMRGRARRGGLRGIEKSMVLRMDAGYMGDSRRDVPQREFGRGDWRLY